MSNVFGACGLITPSYAISRFLERSVAFPAVRAHVRTEVVLRTLNSRHYYGFDGVGPNAWKWFSGNGDISAVTARFCRNSAGDRVIIQGGLHSLVAERIEADDCRQFMSWIAPGAPVGS